MNEPQPSLPQLQPQLRMKCDLTTLPALVVPPGYELRHFTPDDGYAWAKLLDTNAELGAWNAARAKQYFASDSPMQLNGAYFITNDGEPVATAQMHLKLDRPNAPTAEIGWVAVVPNHQGHGLAAVVCLAVMQYAASMGYREISLYTDDYRLPAIRTYLRLGFVPWHTDDTHPARWETVYAVLEQYRRAGTTPAASAAE